MHFLFCCKCTRVQRIFTCTKYVQMSYASVIQRTARINKKGLAPLHLIVRYNGKQTELSLRRRVSPNDWNADRQEVRKPHAEAKIINAKIRKAIREVNTFVDEQELLGQKITLGDIVAYYKNGQKPLPAAKKPKKDEFFIEDFLQDFIDKNPENLRFNTIKTYVHVRGCLLKYAPQLRPKDLNLAFFQNYESHLQKRGYRINTIADRMKILRKCITIFLRDGVLDRNPMIAYKTKNEESQREFLTVEELRQIEAYQPRIYSEGLAKDVFLFMCYTGLRFSDICQLKGHMFQKNESRITMTIRMEKTRKPLTIPLSQQAKSLYWKYVSTYGMYIFPLLHDEKDYTDEAVLKKAISSRNSFINKYLKPIAKHLKIPKRVSCHVARHTFATISLTLGIPIEVVSKLLGHKNIRETQIYAKIVDSKKDEAIDVWDKMGGYSLV